jgi:hypothetical protein
MEGKENIPSLLDRWANCERFVELAKALGIGVTTVNRDGIELERSGKKADVSLVFRELSVLSSRNCSSTHSTTRNRGTPSR